MFSSDLVGFMYLPCLLVFLGAHSNQQHSEMGIFFLNFYFFIFISLSLSRKLVGGGNRRVWRDGSLMNICGM